MRIETVSLKDLPRNWSASGPPPHLQKIGDEWLERGAAVALKVPSAIVTEEWNYLLNPSHPDFKKLKLIEPEVFSFDRRVARSRKGRSNRPDFS